MRGEYVILAFLVVAWIYAIWITSRPDPVVRRMRRATRAMYKTASAFTVLTHATNEATGAILKLKEAWDAQTRAGE